MLHDLTALVRPQLDRLNRELVLDLAPGQRDLLPLVDHVGGYRGKQLRPMLVFLSYFLPAGKMNLRFTPFEVLSILVTVVAVHLVAQDGESNWLEGALLVAVYAVLALAAWRARGVSDWGGAGGVH